MTIPTTLLDEALEAWEGARKGIIEELKCVPPQHLHYRPESGARTVAEIVQHVGDTSLMWAGELSNPNGDFTRKSFNAFIKEYGTPLPERPTDKTGFVRLLGSSHAVGVKRLKGVGEIALLQTICRFDGQSWTRMAWMQHGIAHEEYHRGQLAIYVRLLGFTPALTKSIADHL